MPISKELPELNIVPSTSRWSPRHSRSLYSNDNYVSYLVDSSGNAYEPYSLAWRYLGMYIDCDLNSTNFYEYYNYKGHRSMPSNDNYEEEECGRKLLWAAYVDPKYKGNNIEEYAFFDLKNETYDDSACLASGQKHRCAKLDCHESWTHFQLVGVFKETQGMYDWTEQLFKHEGYCIWQGEDDGDVYNTMETWMEKWPTTCKQLAMPDYYGNTLYIAVHPLPEGNMTLEIYTDNICTMLSEEMDLESYIIKLYSYYGYNDRGKQVAQNYADAIDTWNEEMSVFKICQPCRAYNLYYDSNSRNSRDQNHRALENDGEGEEQERYNCYDDAGYTNVNQCYKFETKTRMEAAYEDDLSLASSQGSILMIKVNGKTYGAGCYSSPFVGGWDFNSLNLNMTPETMMYISFASIALLWISMLFFFHRRHKKKCKALPRSVGGSSYEGDDGGYYSDSSVGTKASEYSKRSGYSTGSDLSNHKPAYVPPTIELTNTATSSPKEGCFEPVSPSESEMNSFEGMARDSNYKQVCYVNYDSKSDTATFKTEQNHGCGIGLQSEMLTVSELETVDSEDRSQLKTDSNSTTFIGMVDKVTHSMDECSRCKEDERGPPPDISMVQSDMSSFDSVDNREKRLDKWKSQQQLLAQSQTSFVREQLQPTLEKVDEEDTLDEALQRVQQRITESKQNADNCNTMSSIV